MAESAGTVYVDVKPLIGDDFAEEIRAMVREIVRDELNRSEV